MPDTKLQSLILNFQSIADLASLLVTVKNDTQLD